MQGDIFQLEQLTCGPVQVAVPAARPVQQQTTRPQVAIYNEDDLSHLLFVNNAHHRQHHHHVHDPHVHPADEGKVIINHVVHDVVTPYRSGLCTPATDEGRETPLFSDCESCSGSEADPEAEAEPTPLTPPSLDAYRGKGRRNALQFEDGFEFPVFLGRQAEGEEEEAVETEVAARPALRPASHVRVEVRQVRDAEEETAHWVKPMQEDEVSGSMMAWWPTPMAYAENDWTEEKMEWALALEDKRLRDVEREGGMVNECIKPSKPKSDNESEKRLRAVKQVEDIRGTMMCWWPAPLEASTYEWSERFYE
ncbi:hypothetical protein F5Y15DRAFT_113079 [Xylariaceae sp. FL0016]|nr:hypothetical protein F5Y15DRAFT_113079 [Xylariaceae sp. FL0016]